MRQGRVEVEGDQNREQTAVVEGKGVQTHKCKKSRNGWEYANYWVKS